MRIASIFSRNGAKLVLAASSVFWIHTTAAETLPIESIEENFSPLVTVSGSPRAGVLTGQIDEPLKRGALWVSLPEEGDGKLCVSIQSRDGRYNATIAADVTGKAPDDYELRFETAYRKELAGSQGIYLAALATIRPSCDENLEKVLVSRWEEDSSDNRITVLINSARLPTSLIIPQKTGTERIVECNSIASVPQVSFDKQCKFEVQPEDNLEATLISRRQFRTLLPLIPLPIAAYKE